MRRQRVPSGYGQWLRFHREQAGLTQRELANAAGLERMTLNALENDRHLPSQRTANVLSKVLGVTPRELFPDLDAPTPIEVLEKHQRRRAKRQVVGA